MAHRTQERDSDAAVRSALAAATCLGIRTAKMVRQEGHIVFMAKLEESKSNANACRPILHTLGERTLGGVQ